MDCAPCGASKGELGSRFCALICLSPEGACGYTRVGESHAALVSRSSLVGSEPRRIVGILWDSRPDIATNY